MSTWSVERFCDGADLPEQMHSAQIFTTKLVRVFPKLKPTRIFELI